MCLWGIGFQVGSTSKSLPLNLCTSKVVAFVSALSILRILCNYCRNENKIFAPSQKIDELSIFTQGGFAASNPDYENLGISYLPNACYAASERVDELLDRNNDRSGAISSRNFNTSNLSKTKILKKVEYFSFLERPIYNIRN